MAQNIGMDNGASRAVLTRRLPFVVGLATVCFLAPLMAGTWHSIVSVPVRAVASYDAAEVAHCSQFVDLARAKFGPEWKRRLDPGNTACAQQIQQAWERDWNPREVLPEPVLQPKILASTDRPPKIAPPEAGPAHTSKDYSLAAVTGADAEPADVAGQEGASSEYGHPSDAALEDGEEGGMSADEQGHEARSFSPSDDGADDDQADDATRALNNAQLDGE